MPLYEYLCDDCGLFTELRPMSESGKPHSCPKCSSKAPRVIFTPPRLACTSATTRKAHETNEQSAHAPKTMDQYKAQHGAGCGCCAGKKSRSVVKTKSGAKSFPTARPWMISH